MAGTDRPRDADADRPTVGLVGAGAMGSGMGHNLLAAGFPLVVLAHRERARVEALVAAGAREAADLPDLARGARVLLLCLPTAEVAASVLGEALPHLPDGALAIDTGTARPETARAMEAACAARGVPFVESPVAGGRQQAEAGELGAMVGGEAAAFARARPVLEAFSASVRHFGPVGTAAVAKLVNNYLVMGMVALVAETYDLADRAGVPWDALYDAMIRGAGDSRVLRRIVGNALAGDLAAYAFPVEGAAKDLSYFRATAEGLGGFSPLARAVCGFFDEAVAAGHGERLLGELLAEDAIAARRGRPATPMEE